MYQKLTLKISIPELWYQALAVSQLELKLLCIHVKQEKKRIVCCALLIAFLNQQLECAFSKSVLPCLRAILLATLSIPISTRALTTRDQLGSGNFFIQTESISLLNSSGLCSLSLCWMFSRSLCWIPRWSPKPYQSEMSCSSIHNSNSVNSSA